MGRGASALGGAAVFALAGAVPAVASSQQRPSAPTSFLVFDGVTVVDVEQGKLLPTQRVVITGNRIRAVGAAAAVKVPTGAQLVDARGKYLIPGLWDLHMHTDEAWEQSLLLANGVTGIRDAFSPTLSLDTLTRWRREALAGTRVAPPRQILSGAAIDEEDGCTRTELFGHICVLPGDTVDARQLVESLKAAGADMIKTYRLSDQAYFVLAAAARRAGIPFGGHTMVSAMEATDSGAVIIDHLKKELDMICMFAQHGNAERCGPVAERFRRNGTWWVPTLLIHSIYSLRGEWPPPVTAASKAIAARFAKLEKEFEAGTTPVGNWLSEAAHSSPTDSSPTDSSGLLRITQRVGMPFLAGTDKQAPLGFGLHAELAIMVAEGLTPLNALQAATLNPAKMLHATDSLGTVATGKLADLVLLDANPLDDITNTTIIRAVVANGRYFDRAALDSLLAEVRAKAGQEP